MVSDTNKNLIPILAVNFIGALSFSIVLPFLFILVRDYGGDAFVYGLIGATFSFFQLIGAPLLGSWSDRIGRRPILLLSQLGTLIAWIIFLYSFFLSGDIGLGPIILTLPLITLFLARALDGITGGNISVANAYLADITPPKQRSRNFGLMGVSASLGFMVGPALSGILGGVATQLGGDPTLRLQLPVFASILISFIGLILILVLLDPNTHKEDSTGEPSTISKPTSPPEHLNFKQTLKLPGISFLLLINFFMFIAFNLFYISFPVFLILDIGWTELELGLFMAFLSILMLLGQGPILNIVNKRIEPAMLMIIGFLLLGVGFSLIALRDIPFLLLSAAFVAFGNSFMYPSLLTLISEHAGSKYQGTVQGFSASVGSLAAIIGLIFGGILFVSFAESVFYLSGIISFILAIFGVRLLRIERAEITHEKKAHSIHHYRQALSSLPHIIHVIPKKLHDLEHWAIHHVKHHEHEEKPTVE